MRHARFPHLLGGALLAGLATLLLAPPVLGDVTVTFGYETRAVGELEPCG